MRPITRRAPVLTLALALVAVGLAGCISLLPKSKPSQLYRFGVPAAAAPTRSDAVGVFRAGGAFQREAAGDRILTVTGDKAAYVAEVRWVAPAEVLFEEAVATAFDSAAGHVRLVARGEPAPAALSLRLDVRNFETRYSGDHAAVLIRVRVVLARHDGRAPPAEKVFEARAPAARNRVGAIVAAYNEALAKVLGEIVAWTDGQAG